jgi:hypothetical protein
MFRIGQMVRYVGPGITYVEGIYQGPSTNLMTTGVITSYKEPVICPNTNMLENRYRVQNNPGKSYYESSLELINPDNESAGSWESVMSEFKVGVEA